MFVAVDIYNKTNAKQTEVHVCLTALSFQEPHSNGQQYFTKQMYLSAMIQLFI